MRSRIFYCMMLVLAIGIANAASVSVSITNSNPMEADDLAGAPGVRVGNWNSWPSQETLGVDEDIIDDSGAATGITMTIDNTGRFNNYFDGDNDMKMFGEAIDVFTKEGNRTVTVSGVPYAEYDVYCYMKDDSSGGVNRAGYFTIGDTTYYIQGLVDEDGWPADDGTGYILSEDTEGDDENIAQGNYCVFKGVTGESFTLEAGGHWGSDGRDRNKFAGFQIVSATERGGSHSPVPTGSDVDSTAVSSVSWYSPLQDDEGVVVGDPNIISVDGYDVYWSTDPNYVTDLPVSVQQPGQSYTPAEIDFETTYYWRVDTYVTWDSNEITGNYTDVIEGSEWQFTTLPDYIAPVLAIDNVYTTLELVPAALSAEVTENSADIVTVAFELLSDDVDFPAGSDAVLADTTVDNQMPTAELTTTVPGTYKVKLAITDAGNLPVQQPTTLVAFAEVVIPEDLCEAAQNAPDGYSQLDFDFDNNCIVDISDFAVFAAEWLTDALLDDQQNDVYIIDYVPQAVYDARIEAEWIDPNDPNACSDGPLSNSTGIRIQDQANASGGQATGYASATAWVEYTIDVPASAVGVPVDVYAGHALSGTGTVTLSFGTAAETDAYGVGTLDGTSSWTNFTSGRKIGEVTFDTAGSQVLQTSYGGGLNLDWFSFDF